MTDDLALLLNTPTLVESWLQNLLQVAGGFDFYVNVNKTNFI